MIIFVVKEEDGKEKRAYVANDKISPEYAKGLLEDLTLGDVEVTVPNKYNKVIGNYINFLHGRASEITTVQKLLDCFLMNTYYSDDEYFKYLVGQMLQHWSGSAKALPDKAKPSGKVKPSADTTVSADKLSSLLDKLVAEDNEYNRYLDLAREIELHLPFNLVSDTFKLRPTFVKEWLAIKDNKNVTMDNGSVVIKTDVATVPIVPRAQPVGTVRKDQLTTTDFIIRVNSQINDQPNSRETTYRFLSNYELMSELPFLIGSDGSKLSDGLERFWWEREEVGNATTRQLEHQEYTVAGLPQGRSLSWWPNGQLQDESYYKDGEIDGLHREFDENGKLIESGSFDMRSEVGEWYRYERTYNTYSYTNYHSGSHGEFQTYQRFDNDGRLLESGEYDEEGSFGVWYEFDLDTSQAYNRKYEYGEMVNEWPTAVSTYTRPPKQT